MSPEALGLVLTAGLLHASWNLILKRTDERLLVASWSLVAGAVLFSPALIRAWPPPPDVWPFVSASASVFVIYYAALSWAYRQGDFSLVYPVARGTAPAMIALWAILFLGERPSALGLAGIGLILLGLVVLGGAPLWASRGDWKRHSRGLLPAFFVALLISIYSVIDGAGVRRWEPVPYIVLTFALSGGVLVPALVVREGRSAVSALRSNLVPIVAIAALTLAAYGLVLRAFQIAPISYAGAAREISIVFGALAGWLLLGERFGGPRTLGAVLVFFGIGVLAIAP